MFRLGAKRLVKYGFYGSVVVGAVAVGISGDTDSLAIVRISRTAYTAIDIGRTYKCMLSSREWDKNSKEYRETMSLTHQKSAEKLLDLCKANKGVYIKVGQHIGALEYLLPNEYVYTMRILHKDAPPNPVEQLYKVIKEELKEDPQTIFPEFDPEPLGTASLAQVHRAKLKDGTEVAVKVQHSLVKKNIYLDLVWMEWIINVMHKVFPDFQMQWLVDETKKNIAMELDFVNEGKNAERVAKLFSHYKWLKIPKIFWDYTTERVLVMEYCRGGYINDLNYIERNGINKTDLCNKIGNLYSEMIFVNGFVHSDPHPGNIMVRQDPQDKEVTVYLLDHGLYAQLTEKFRYHYSKLWLGILNKNQEEMQKHAEALGVKDKMYILLAVIVSGRPWNSILKGVTTKPIQGEKEEFQSELPHFVHYVTQCLEMVDRQALLVFKTNDLIRSIEYSLGVQNRKSGFITMTKCCMKSVYNRDYQEKSSFFVKQLLTLKYGFSLLMIYFYEIYLGALYKLGAYS